MPENGQTEDLRLYLLLGLTSVISCETVYSLLLKHNLVSYNHAVDNLFVIWIPTTVPSTYEEAQQWSRQYWPTTYKKHNPLGPQHNVLSKAAQEIVVRVQDFILLAERVGHCALDSGIGEKFGAVIVDCSAPTTPGVIVAAGDARWKDHTKDTDATCGNVMAHAVMRAIDLVARKRRDSLQNTRALEDSKSEQCLENLFTDLERDVYDRSSLTPGGYLCSNLDLYVTHEPCVMCCMAILHSRFRNVIFSVRMSLTGGLISEDDYRASTGGPSYGLFWQPSLNWRFLAWQWTEAHQAQGMLCHEALHA